MTIFEELAEKIVLGTGQGIRLSEHGLTYRKGKTTADLLEAIRSAKAIGKYEIVISSMAQYFETILKPK